ncbi:MAG: VCBS repeat-containing protein [Verrucomicrobia bacterium]|nr:VCBS repeat-containing protein [Verrucomicrobiota bacterium]
MAASLDEIKIRNSQIPYAFTLISRLVLITINKSNIMKTSLPLLSIGALFLYGITGFAQPAITTQPTNQSVSLGANVEFRVTATGTPPLTYEWRFNDQPIAGATTSQLTITNVQLAHAGRYDVIVSGTETSQSAILDVDPTFTKITTGPIVTELGGFGSWGDYDNDGYADLLAGRYKLGPNVLYHNNRDGAFTSVTNAFTTTDAWESLGWADLDNDGWLDLVAARDNKPSTVYFNNGDGTFTASSFGSMVPWNVGVADYDRDGLLDLYIPVTQLGPNRLYRNRGDRTFQQMTAAEVGPLVTVTTYGGVTWADYDDDGWMDVYAARNQTLKGLLFRSAVTGRFLRATNEVTLDITTGGFNGAWGDYDNDGRLDLFVAGLFQPSALYRNLGNGDFERAIFNQSSLGNNSSSWADYDNDGFLDLFMSNGQGHPNELHHNNGDGTFTRVTTGSIVTDQPENGAVCYSGLWFDYDNDGFLDLHVATGDDTATIRSKSFLYHNNGNSNAWLKVKLVGTASNRDGVGAKVRVQAKYAGQTRWQRRDVSAGDYWNGNQLIAFFGLGNATNANIVRIEWPSGIVQELTNVPVKQLLTVTEPARLNMTRPGELRIQSWKGQRFQIESSTDLKQWTPLTTATNETGALIFTDPTSGSADKRFYRTHDQ